MPANILPTHTVTIKKAQHYRTKQLGIKNHSCTKNYKKPYKDQNDNSARLSEKRPGFLSVR